MAKVRLKPVTSRGRPVPITNEPITIGRHPENMIRIQDEKASRYHCVVEVSGKKLFVRDLNSRNGTSVNDQPISAPKSLRPGDVIKVGDHEFAIEVVGVTAVSNAVSIDEKPLRGRALERAKAEQAEREEHAVWIEELTSIVQTATKDSGESFDLELIDAGGNPSRALDGGSTASVACKLMLQAAHATRSTDIHLEPRGEHYSLRMRIDGQMVWVTDLPNQVGLAIGNIIKTVCLITQQRQDAVIDGSFGSKYETRRRKVQRVNYRASFTPTVHGPKAVIRLLDASAAPGSIDDLGLPTYMGERLKRIVGLDAGLLLVCGPTGSGKTTTLYNAIREIDRDRRNVITIEDPVEYQLPNTTQIPVNHDQGNDFSNILRSVLRQDPDVILVGEIRDIETARTAMQAAMTGHLVFSTVHAKDTISSVFRLLDLGVEPYLLANSLQVVLAQRLVRVLCQHCKRDMPVPPGVATQMGRFLDGKTRVYTPVGCKACLKTGYLGRRAIFEMLDVNDEFRDVILNNPTIQAMRRIVSQGLFTNLQQSGWKLVAASETSLEEVDRVAAGAS